MKKIVLCIGIAAVLVIFGCDPLGTEETKVYVTGIIYADTVNGTPLEGVVVILELNPDTTNVHTNDVMTNAAGVFFMEVQVYPSPPAGDVTGYTMPSVGIFGLSAHYSDWFYLYRDGASNPFQIGIGDTLYVWPVAGAAP
jgi:hypothetical protein